MISNEVNDHHFKKKLPDTDPSVSSHITTSVKPHTEAPQAAARDGSLVVGTHIFTTGDQRIPADSRF